MAAENEVNHLVSSSGELLTHLAEENGPEINALKDRVRASIASVTKALKNSAEQVGGQAREAAIAVDDYVHDNPWVAVGIASLVAAALGFAAGANTGRRSKFLGLF